MVSELEPGAMRDAVIVGAGPAGSSLATVLAELGWNILLVERQRFPYHKVCGEFLSPESQASLLAMSLYQVVEALSPARMEQAKFVSRMGVTARVALPGSAWGVSRFALDAALASAAHRAGAEVRTGVTATSVTRDDRGFEVELRSRDGPAVVRARAVIAACGRHTLPGLPPRLTSPSPRPTYVGVKCHYQDVTMPARVELFLFRGGYAGVCPIEDGRVNFCLLATQAAFVRAGRSVRSMLEAAARRNRALGNRLAGGRALPETEVAAAPVDTDRPASPWDEIACVGDTAGVIPPVTGDGMAMALRSAELCAPLAHDFLRSRLSLAEWEVAYRKAWHAEFDGPVRVGRYLQAILGVPALSDAFIGVARLIPPLTAHLVRATRSRQR